MLQDRCRNGNAIFFFQRLSEAGDAHLLKREGNVTLEATTHHARIFAHLRSSRWSWVVLAHDVNRHVLFECAELLSGADEIDLIAVRLDPTRASMRMPALLARGSHA